MDKKYTILVVDDKVENLKYLSQILKDDYDIRASTDGKLSIEAAFTIKPDLILLDINLPDISGYDICQKIKQKEELKETPVIFISAYEDIEHKIKAFENGGVDYITKPFEAKEVLARVKTQLEIYNQKRTIQSLLTQQDLFIKKIMHEMNTPLSIISLNLNSLEQEVGPKQEFESIQASIKTLSSIYGDLSYMIKKESRNYEQKEINLTSFLTSRVMFFDEMANVKNIAMHCEFDEDIILFINEYELERIIDNTLSNAIKYSNEDSEVLVIVEHSDNKIYLKIVDEGIGIEDTQNVFAPYFQQSKNNHGLGLGLNIVKEICTKYNINIEVQSQTDKGTSFIYDITPIVKEIL